MDKNFKSDLIKERKEKLGLNDTNTSEVFNTILIHYKKTLLDAPKNISDYSISIVFTNMNGLNHLGIIDELYQTWGDNYFVDKNNSSLVPLEVNEDGQIEFDDSISFKDISGLENIDQTSFSLKELIDLCKEYNFNIKLYSKDDDDVSTIEIEVLKSFIENESIDRYLKQIK